MFNMLLIYQGTIQPNAQMLLTANFGEEQMTKQLFFQPSEPPFPLDDPLCLSLVTQGRETDGRMQLSQ